MRQYIYKLLNGETKSKAVNKIFLISFFIIILLNVIAVVLETDVNIYQQYQVPYEFVGNPLADEISVAGASCNLSVSSNPQEKVLAILPGSRHSEIQQLTRDFLEAADLCRQKYPDLQIITSMVNLQRQKEFEIIFKETKLNLPIKILPCGLSHEAMAAADVILLASGTATLEALLFEKPMVVAYRVNWLSYFLAKFIFRGELIK